MDILEDLEVLILQNEDDFDRGIGKYILRKFIKDKQAKQLTLTSVSQQSKLFNTILDFIEELPMCYEDYHRSELWEKYKALNCT